MHLYFIYFFTTFAVYQSDMAKHTNSFPVLGFIATLTLSSVFWLWYFSPESTTETIALFGGILALTMAFFSLIYAGIQRRTKKNSVLFRNAFLFFAINISLLLLYIWFGFKTLDIERVTFVNNTNFTISEIKISGAANAEAGELASGQRVRIHAEITSDGEIYLSYNQNDTTHKRIINGYTTPLMGSKYFVFADATNIHKKKT